MSNAPSAPLTRPIGFTAITKYANRLAVLNFLNSSGIPARLVMLYFCGDKRPDRFKCPASPETWQPVLDEQARQLGLEHNHPLSDRVHKLFLPVIEAR